MLPDLLEPLLGDAPAAGHVLQERDDVVRAFGAAEGEQQQGVVRGSVTRFGHGNDPATLPRAVPEVPALRSRAAGAAETE
ncbi:hypothetical protein GCM10020367_48900 [Streptomyces sannanensis]|uniref:Uncharacterized protein n=1 Tax=Streptomyces sannanensis TaxID=285536 RepID=A0ABP6SHL9_9ACTN